jgi:hypothetical protein
MARDLVDSLNLKSLAPVLGVGGTCLVKLVRGGRIPVWIRGGNDQKKRYIFRRSEVLAWMAALIGGPPKVSATPVGMVSIAEAPLRSNVAVNVLVDAIESKRIRVEAMLQGRLNFSGALVMLEAVKAYRLFIGAKKAGDSIMSYRTRLESRSRRFNCATRGTD